MSTLKTNNLQHLDSGSANIELAKGGGAIHSGISTFNKVSVGSATTFTDDLVVNGDARITGILTIGTGSITLDPNNDEIKLGQTKLKRESDGEIKITDLQGNLKGLRGKRFRIQVTASEKNKNGVEVGTGATITSPNDNELSFRLNDQPRVKIDANGKVGIGTTVPNEALHIYTTSSAEAKIESTSNSGIAAITLKANGGQVNFGEPLGSNNRGRIQYSNAANTITGAAADRLEFFTNNDTSNSAILIQADNKVGISSNLPNASLEVNVADGDAGFRVRNTASGAGNNKFQVFARSSGDTDYHTVAYVDKDGHPLNHFTYAGTSYNYASVFAGRTKSNASTPASYYRHGAHSFDCYSARTDDQSNYRSRCFMRAWDAGDNGDRNVIYYVDSGSDTTTVDYDAHQKFGIKADGAFNGLARGFFGRVESDESSPNSVYGSGRGGVYGYETNSTAVVYYLAEAGGSSSTYFAFARTSNNDTQWKHRTSDGRMYVDASATTFSGADYAEYFEWSDGNSANEDRAGYCVVLKDGDKIGIATAGDSPSSIIGVISAAPAIIGDGQDLSWRGKWKKDEFGREITTPVQYLVWNHGYENDENGNRVPVKQPDPTHQMSMEDADSQAEVGPKLDKMIADGKVPQFAIDNNIIMNATRRVKDPLYDETKKYVSREFRQEWSPVGLVGKLIVRKGQVMGDRWIKMKDINDQLEQWLVR